MLDVIFRAERSGSFRGDITAVFPSLAAGPKDWCVCYAYIGQHSGCSREWYHGTRPAKPDEYADLLTELRGIYGEATLRVMKRARR